jgi:hypothetical protein
LVVVGQILRIKVVVEWEDGNKEVCALRLWGREGRSGIAEFEYVGICNPRFGQLTQK